MTSMKSVADVCSASAVEPRTSANRIDISTSAPASCCRIYCSHVLHSFGLKLEGYAFDSQLNGRAIGRLHSKQRDPPGISPKIRRIVLIRLAYPGLNPSFVSPVRYQYQFSSKCFLSTLTPLSRFPYSVATRLPPYSGLHD